MYVYVDIQVPINRIAAGMLQLELNLITNWSAYNFERGNTSFHMWPSYEPRCGLNMTANMSPEPNLASFQSSCSLFFYIVF